MKIPHYIFLALLFSNTAAASITGQSIMISGIPEIGSINTTIDSDEIEVYNGFSYNILFYLGETATRGYQPGFINVGEASSYFNLDIFELSSGNLQIDIWLGGTQNPIDVLIDGFNPAQTSIDDITVIRDIEMTTRFIDPDTGKLLYPITTAIQTDLLPGSRIGSALNVNSGQTSVGFSIDAGYYNHQVSLLVETTTIPLPAAAWLFLTATGALVALRKSA